MNVGGLVGMAVLCLVLPVVLDVIELCNTRRFFNVRFNWIAKLFVRWYRVGLITGSDTIIVVDAIGFLRYKSVGKVYRLDRMYSVWDNDNRISRLVEPQIAAELYCKTYYNNNVWGVRCGDIKNIANVVIS